jgi:hypothetical protein
MVNPDSSGLDEDELAEAETAQQYAFNRHAELYRSRRRSLQDALPGLDVQSTPREDDYTERAQCLRAFASNVIEILQQEVSELGDANEQLRFESRVDLLAWVQYILIHDASITKDRASVIHAAFILNVVRYKLNWQEFNPEFLANDGCQRLAQLTNNHPAAVCQWVVDSLGPFCTPEFYVSLRTGHADWVRRDRERADVVRRNIVQATEADLEGMRLDSDSDAACAICFGEFEEHETALSKLPVQNRRCQRHRHWTNQACLVRFARTLHGVDMVAPDPRCPVCRTEFTDPEKPGDAAMLGA